MKTNMTLKISIFNRKYSCKWWIFHCHVSFQGGYSTKSHVSNHELDRFFSVTETRQSRSSGPTSIARKKTPPSSSTHCLTMKNMQPIGDIFFFGENGGALVFFGWGVGARGNNSNYWSSMICDGRFSPRKEARQVVKKPASDQKISSDAPMEWDHHGLINVKTQGCKTWTSPKNCLRTSMLPGDGENTQMLCSWEWKRPVIWPVGRAGLSNLVLEVLLLVAGWWLQPIWNKNE